MAADHQHETENQNGAMTSKWGFRKSIQDFDPPKKPKRNKFAFACAILASMTSILLGYDIGVMSGAIIFIRKDIKMTDVEEEVLMGILNLYSLLASAAAGRTSDLIGRRYTIVLAGAIFFLGALLMGFATNYAFLMFGRFVAGIGIGYALMIAPVYTAEVSPALSRGFLTSFPEEFFLDVSNYAFSKLPQHLGWRFMLGIGAIPSIVIGFSVLAMPESPRWLVMQGRLGDAKRVLQKTSESKEEAELRLSDIKEAAGIPEEYDGEIVTVPERNKGSGVWRELFLQPTPAVRHILIVGVGMHFFQQVVGIDAVVLYSPTIFGKAGITNSDHKLLTTIGVGFVKTSSILIATFLVDRIGRRPLLLSSITGMIGSLIGLATFLTIIDRSSTKLMWAIVLCILSTLSYVAFFSIGIGPVTWVYSSEIFPLRLRAQGCAAGVLLNRATSGLLTMTFISLYKAITIGGAFFLYAALATVAWVFFYSMMPETQGRNLEEMEKLFGRYCQWRTSLVELDAEKKNTDAGGKVNGDEVQLTQTGNQQG